MIYPGIFGFWRVVFVSLVLIYRFEISMSWDDYITSDNSHDQSKSIKSKPPNKHYFMGIMSKWFGVIFCVFKLGTISRR